MKYRQSGLSQEVSDSKAGISVRSGKRVEKGVRNEPILTGLTLWEYLDEHYPGSSPL